MQLAKTAEFIGVKDAASFLDITPGSLYNLKFQGAIPSYKPNGKKLLFKTSELQAFVEAGRIPSNSEIESTAAAASSRSK